LKSYLPLVIALAVLAVLQALVGSAPYATYLATRVGIFVLLAVSLNIINGMTGQFSIGHAGFMAVGAYTSTLLTQVLVQYRTPLPEAVTDQLFFILSLVVGGACAGLAGFLVGLPSLRLKGDYLAIVTLGFGEIIRVIVTNSKTAGGALGLSGIPARTTLFMVWLWVFIVVLFARRLAASTHGRQLLAIREDEVAAEAMGVDTTSYKVRAFVVSSFFAGVAGGLFAHFLQAINPGNFTFVQSIEVVVMVVAGGLGSTTGAIVAAIFLVLLPEGLRSLFQSQAFMDLLGSKDQSLAQKVDQIRMPIYGILLVIIMLTRPQGIFGTHEAWDLWKKKKAPGKAVPA
jgi:branched-chain amino acid transport system permease protein